MLFLVALMNVSEVLQDQEAFDWAIESLKDELSNLKTETQPYQYVQDYLLK